MNLSEKSMLNPLLQEFEYEKEPKISGQGADVRVGQGADVRVGQGADERVGQGADGRMEQGGAANLAQKQRQQLQNFARDQSLRQKKELDKVEGWLSSAIYIVLFSTWYIFLYIAYRDPSNCLNQVNFGQSFNGWLLFDGWMSLLLLIVSFLLRLGNKDLLRSYREGVIPMPINQYKDEKKTCQSVRYWIIFVPKFCSMVWGLLIFWSIDNTIPDKTKFTCSGTILSSANTYFVTGVNVLAFTFYRYLDNKFFDKMKDYEKQDKINLNSIMEFVKIARPFFENSRLKLKQALEENDTLKNEASVFRGQIRLLQQEVKDRQKQLKFYQGSDKENMLKQIEDKQKEINQLLGKNNELETTIKKKDETMEQYLIHIEDLKEIIAKSVPQKKQKQTQTTKQGQKTEETTISDQTITDRQGGITRIQKVQRFIKDTTSEDVKYEKQEKKTGEITNVEEKVEEKAEEKAKDKKNL